jgi:hypothetical protein
MYSNLDLYAEIYGDLDPMEITVNFDDGEEMPEILPCDGDAYASCEPGGCPLFDTCRYGADRYYSK